MQRKRNGWMISFLAAAAAASVGSAAQAQSTSKTASKAHASTHAARTMHFHHGETSNVLVGESAPNGNMQHEKLRMYDTEGHDVTPETVKRPAWCEANPTKTDLDEQCMFHITGEGPAPQSQHQQLRTYDTEGDDVTPEPAKRPAWCEKNPNKTDLDPRCMFKALGPN